MRFVLEKKSCREVEISEKVESGRHTGQSKAALQMLIVGASRGEPLECTCMLAVVCLKFFVAKCSNETESAPPKSLENKDCCHCHQASKVADSKVGGVSAIRCLQGVGVSQGQRR